MTILTGIELLEKVIEAQTDFFKPKSEVLDESDRRYLRPGCFEHNLIRPFSNWENEIKTELKRGKGGELEGRKPHFLAVHSSSALCVNNFAPFKEHHAGLSFLGYSGFREARFEEPFPTGLQGIPPHLDFYLENDTTVIGFESKFTEYIARRQPNGEKRDSETNILRNNLEKYCDRMELSYLPEEFRTNIIKHYYNDSTLQHLDVAQLIKHTIGLLNYCRKNNKEKAVLVYLYWEPLDWETLNSTDCIFAEHRRNIEDFKHRIEQFSPVKFIPWSYPEFWKRCENDALLDASLKEHIGDVRTRYGRVRLTG
jgi:hypothetical protein